ncbi:MAG: hypothetical protein M3R03_05630 [Pseudomonadota bacterium]|nr:hypothetical protein [Pseudomonadota bacterium]
MSRLPLVFALILASCAEEQPTMPGLVAGTYEGGNRDALCIAGAAGGQRAGFIVYSPDRANCSVSGRVEQGGSGWNLIPAGDEGCKIPLTATAEQVSLGEPTPGCAYYCGPGAAYGGKAFKRSQAAVPVADLAGDPLC